VTARVVCRPPFSAWTCSGCNVEFVDCAPPVARMGLVCQGCLDAGAGMGEPFIPLTVPPRKVKVRPERRMVVAVSVSEGMCLVEREDQAPELITLEQLVERLRERPPGRPMTKASRDVEQLPPAIVVCEPGSGTDLLGYLNSRSELTSSRFWQWKVSLRDHSPWRPEARSQRVFTRECVDLFGFASKRGDERRAGGRSRYYQVLDPAQFSDAAGRMVVTGGYEGLESLLRFGQDVRAFVNEQGLRMATTAAGVAAQLLRDPRFWPAWRRKMPAADNARAREQLPGNHYQLCVDELAPPADAHKLDMHAAHHTTAAFTEMPAADTFRCHGNFKHPPAAGAAYELDDFPERRGLGREILEQHGMFCVALNVRRAAVGTFSLPAVRQPGRHWRYVFSTELAEILELERRRLVRIERIEAAWCSPDVDRGLSEYAWWAVDQLRRGDSYRRRWLKPALLAAYGLLAAKPRRHRNAWAWANSELSIVIHTRHGDLFGVERATTRARESQTANVIWRCLIESALRAAVLARARELEREGHRVVSLYADAIFTRGDPPAAPPPWRYEGVRHKLKFYGACHYASVEEVRLPGIKRAERDRVEMFKRQMRDRKVTV
jgi:hypothetical protein